MPNAWTNHIKEWASKNNMSYMCAMSQPACREAYKKPEKVKKPKKVKAPKKVKEPKKAKVSKVAEETQKQKEKLYNDGLEKIKQKVRTDFIPAMKEVFFYIKKILFSKKPPTEEVFEDNIEKIKKKYNIDESNLTDDSIQKIFEIFKNKKQSPQDLFYEFWRDNFIEIEFHNYWAFDKSTDIVKLYMDMKGLDSNDEELYDDALTKLDEDKDLEDLANDEYKKVFTDKWIDENMKK